MHRPARTLVKAPIVRMARRTEVHFTLEELARATGISRARLSRLVGLGLVEPTMTGSSPFTAATAVRLRRMLRLHADLGVNLTGAAIILDLVQRLEVLQAELARRWGGS